MLSIKEVAKTPTNRRIFRTISRDNSGESMEPADGEKIFFGYGDGKIGKDVQVIASMQLANPAASDKSKEHFHWLTFLFVKKDFQCMGLGTKMLNHVHDYAWNFLARTIRTNSARKSVGFFKKNGYNEVGDVYECMCPGGGIFHFLQTMEKQPPECVTEWWD